jgi:RND family efflux transporter MFP subunit
MNTSVKTAAGICLGASLFVAGYLVRGRLPSGHSAAVSQTSQYICPMHPEYTSNRPGDAPCCGMRMVPAAGHSVPGTAAAPGTVKVSAARQQIVGIRTEEVRHRSDSQYLRLPGRIAVDEERLYPVVAAVDGWIRQIGQNTAGVFVRRDEVLASFYAREFFPAQQTFLFVLTATGQAQATAPNLRPTRVPVDINLQTATDALRNLGAGDRQIEEIRQSREYHPLIQIRSPADGFVLARNIAPEQRFERGAELYRIADLRRVWVIADIFEHDRELVRPGAAATVRYGRHEMRARISNTLAPVDPQSRTLRTRFEVDNPGYVLRPDAFVDVEVHVSLPPAITVPADAVLQTGVRKIVYIERSEGTFEPRAVELGTRFGDRVQITEGLNPGERIVVAGNFLVDSESRIKLAVAGAAAQTAATETDPVCGMEVEPSKAKYKSQHGGRTYYFCAESCKKSFDGDPAKYTPKGPSAAKRLVASTGKPEPDSAHGIGAP